MYGNKGRREGNTMDQISIFDYIQPEYPPIGKYLSKEEVGRYKGEMIPFQALENYIGKKVLLELPRESSIDYKAVKITSYHRDHDKVYRWSSEHRAELSGYCDRIGYSDNARKEKENSWTSEMYCRNGRLEGGIYPTCMFQLRYCC